MHYELLSIKCCLGLVLCMYFMCTVLMFVQAVNRFHHKPPPAVGLLMARLSKKKRKTHGDDDAGDEEWCPVKSKRSAAGAGGTSYSVAYLRGKSCALIVPPDLPVRAFCAKVLYKS